MTRDRFPMVVHVLLLRPSEAIRATGSGGRRELFMLRRAGTGFMDGYYVPPGGHVQAGESLTEAAARECAEETGAAPGRLRPVCVLPYRSGGHQGINMVFEGLSLTSEPAIGEPEHSDAAGWFPLEDLPRPSAPWLADALELESGGEWFRELHWP